MSPYYIKQDNAREALRYLEHGRINSSERTKRICMEAAQLALEDRLLDFGRQFGDSIILAEMLDIPYIGSAQIKQHQTTYPPYDHNNNL